MDPWDDIAAADARTQGAVKAERDRCLALLAAEVDAGRARGLPDAAPVMAILLRLKAGVEAG